MLDDLLPAIDFIRSWSVLIYEFGVLLLLTVTLALYITQRRYQLVDPVSKSDGKHSEIAPRSLPVLSDSWNLLSNGLTTFLTTNMLEHCRAMPDGSPFKLQLAGQPAMFVLSTPADFEDVLATRFNNFERGVNETFFELTGESIFAVDGPAWKKQRRLFAKLFSPHALRDGGDVTRVVNAHVDNLKLKLTDHIGETVNLSKLLSMFTMNVITELGFGVTVDKANDDALSTALNGVTTTLTKRFLLPPWLWKLQRAIGFGLERDLQKHLDVVDRAATSIINRSIQNRYKQTETFKRNIVSVAVDELLPPDETSTEANDDSAIDMDLLRALVRGFLVGGRDSTSQTLSWFFACVMRHPDVERQILDELARVQGNQDGELPLEQLVFLEATLRETMRLYPIVAFNSRICIVETKLADGTVVRVGDRVGLPTFAVQRLERIWGDDASEFKPERWIDANGKLRRVSAFQFPVFHAGPRVCLGLHLALIEMKMMAATLLATFRFELPPDASPATYVASLVQPMKEPLSVRVQLRESAL